MWETSFLIISLVILLLAACSIPFCWQMWQAAKNMATLLDSLNQSLPAILRNLDEITTNINSATYLLRREAEEISLLGNRIRNILDFSTDVERILLAGLKRPLGKTFKTACALLKGVRVFIDVFHSQKNS